MRTCVKCEVEQDDAQFIYGKVTRTDCRSCHNKARREAATKYKEKAKTIKKTCTECKKELCGSKFAYSLAICKSCKSERDKEENHKPAADAPPKTCGKCIKEQPAKEFRYQSKICLTCEKDRLYEWRKENPDKFKEICKTYREKDENKVKRKDYLRNKYHADMNFRLERLYRTRVRYFIKGGTKTGKEKYETLLGCSWDTLRLWLESNFVDGMNWENYGTVWHIDHTMPCSVFDFYIEENRKVCFNWTNLFPMFGSENLSKSAKIDMVLITKNKEKARNFLKSHSDLILTESLPSEYIGSESGVLDTKVPLKDGTGE